MPYVDKRGNLTMSFKQGDYLAAIKAGLAQLEFYRKQGSSSKTLDINREIDGYKEVIATDSQKVAFHFLDLKAHYRRAGGLRPDNLKIVEELKASGHWMTDEEKT